jgi:myo-inositol catabolism protein IolC
MTETIPDDQSKAVVPKAVVPKAVAPTADGGRPLLILAADHRNSLERDLYGLSAPPTPTQAARIAADKLLIYQALLDAAADLPSGVQPGILIDEQYGASVAELASRSEGAVSLSMPIEASGDEWSHFAYGDDWVGHAEQFATDHAKVLVRDNPGLDPAPREEQARRLAEVSAWAASSHRSLILELLVPATPADSDRTGGEARRYDDELRPGYTLEVMSYLQAHDVEPAIWKIEGLGQPRRRGGGHRSGGARRPGGSMHRPRTPRPPRRPRPLASGGRPTPGVRRLRHRPVHLVGSAPRPPAAPLDLR